MNEGECIMSDERVKVLEMLVAGKLTVEQANQLIEVLDVQPLSARKFSGSQVPQGVADADYIKRLREVGLTDLRPDHVIALRMHRVEPAYISALREVGLTDLRPDHVIALRMHQVEPAYISALREVGLTDLQPDHVIALRMHQVEPT